MGVAIAIDPFQVVYTYPTYISLHSLYIIPIKFPKYIPYIFIIPIPFHTFSRWYYFPITFPIYHKFVELCCQNTTKHRRWQPLSWWVFSHPIFSTKKKDPQIGAMTFWFSTKPKENKHRKKHLPPEKKKKTHNLVWKNTGNFENFSRIQ